MRSWLAAGLSLICLSTNACSSSTDSPAAPVDSGIDDSADTGGDSGPQDPLAVSCTDAADAIYADPGMLPADKGAIMKCTRDASISKADLEAELRKQGYKGRALTSGAHVYRIVFRTERGSTPVLPGSSSAIVYLPDTPRSAKLPIIVAGHGSRGQATLCAPSRFSPQGEDVRGDFVRQLYPLVGFGYAVIAPDNAGYANYGAANNPVPGYAATEDVGKSMLDATRALQKLVPSMLDNKVVITGHSQGGHSALSALAMSDTYGAAAPVAATAVYAPLWLAERSWGALLLLSAVYPFKDSPAPGAVSIWYHYTHGELFDGPGHGVDVFAESKRPLVKKFVDEVCWGDWSRLEALGAEPADVFDPTFTDAISSAAASTNPCPMDEPKKSLCEKWMARYRADRPALTGNAAKVPILFLYGNADTTIPPNRATCARDWLTKTGGNVTYCVEPDANHNSILDVRGDYVSDWIAAQALGGTAPAACAKTANDILDPMTKMPATCDAAPPNE
ncbi:MAG: alpha/beta hydrolase family protein [Polyangiales bacterium]